MAAGGNVGSRWWHRVGSNHFHPPLPPSIHTRWVNHINLLVQPPLGSSEVCESWHWNFLSSNSETTAENQAVTSTLCSPRPGQMPSVIQVLPPHFKPSFWPSYPAANRHLQSLHLCFPTLHLSLGVLVLVANPGPQVPQGGTGWRCHKAVQAARREQGACWLLDVPGSCANMIARWEITQLRNITETGGGSRLVEMVRKAEVASQVPRKATATFQEPFKVHINNNRRS